MRRIEADRREDGLHFAMEIRLDPDALLLVPLRAAEHADPLGAERGQKDVVQGLVLIRDELVRDLAQAVQRLLRSQAVRPGVGEPGLDLLQQARGADLEELVEVRRRDREEPQPLEQRHARVLRLLDDAAVELEERELAVEVEVRIGDRGAGGRRLLAGYDGESFRHGIGPCVTTGDPAVYDGLKRW